MENQLSSHGSPRSPAGSAVLWNSAAATPWLSAGPAIQKTSFPPPTRQSSPLNALTLPFQVTVATNAQVHGPESKRKQNDVCQVSTPRGQVILCGTGIKQSDVCQVSTPRRQVILSETGILVFLGCTTLVWRAKQPNLSQTLGPQLLLPLPPLYICVCVCPTEHVWRSEDNPGVSSSTTRVLRILPRLSDLVASVFINLCCVIHPPHTHTLPSSVFLICFQY